MTLFDNPMKKIKYLSFAVSAVLLANILSSCNTSSAEKNKNESADKPKIVIETFSLAKEKFSTRLQIPGELTAFQQVDLYAKVTGFVKQLNVDIGSEVKAGQLLLTLDAPELSSQTIAAESRLKALEATYIASNANYNRLVETSKTPGTISQNDLDLAIAKRNSDLANFEASKASSREINEIKNYLQIRAPFNSIVTARSVNLGAYVGPSGKGSEYPLLTLQQQDKLRLVISVPEAFTGYVRNGDEVTFKVRSLPGETFKGTVKRMAGALDLRLRAERVEIDIANSNKKLLPGTVADVTLLLSAKDSTFTIPKSALVNATEGVFVIKVTDGKAERVDVKKGRELDTKVEIFNDNLRPGDTFVTKGSDEIKNGATLNIQ
jgi:membrane fusion protein (multidrug efflux system)